MNRKTRYCAWLAAAGLLLVSSVSVALDKLKVDYVRPGVDFSQYDSVYLYPLDFSKAKVVKPAWAEAGLPQKWDISHADQARVQSLFLDTIKQEVEKDTRFKVVDRVAGKTLEVEVSITRLMPYAARGEDVMTKGTGEITVKVSITDGATGDLLGIMTGDQAVGESYQQNSIESDEANVRGLFKTWGERVRARLQATHPKKKK